METMEERREAAEREAGLRAGQGAGQGDGREYLGARRMRTVGTEFRTRDDGGARIIEGYFAVFGSNYEIGQGMTESVDRAAFDNTLSRDIRALTNHNTTLVLGRTKVKTLELRVDARGLWGRIEINPNDLDAVNLYERVKRGDVDQCSFGFDIVAEDTEYRDDGSVHWTIKEVILYEVSCCTFPAYEETSISARAAQRDALQRRAAEAWRARMKERLKRGAGKVEPSGEA